MSSTSFTFLNATGAPGLSQSDAKRMRAHITRTNFANRRQRFAQARTVQERSGRVSATGTRQELLLADLLLKAPPKDPYRYSQFRKNTASFN